MISAERGPQANGIGKWCEPSYTQAKLQGNVGNAIVKKLINFIFWRSFRFTAQLRGKFREM